MQGDQVVNFLIYFNIISFNRKENLTLTESSISQSDFKSANNNLLEQRPQSRSIGKR